MSDFIHIEPGKEQRRAFARWCLAQTPPIQTASSTGSDVPLDLYPQVPFELLQDSYVDGFPYNRPEFPQAPVTPASEATVAPASTEDGTDAEAGDKPTRKRSPRKPRKTAAPKLTTKAAEATSLWPDVTAD